MTSAPVGSVGERNGEVVGTVEAVWRYPVKSMQGRVVGSIEVTSAGVAGDRAFALVDVATGRIASAKRFARILEATGDDDAVVLADGTVVPLGAPDADERLSAWLGHTVTVARPDPAVVRSYEMTFDPPDDEAELFDIPAPVGSFLDLAPLHLVNLGTLAHCAQRRPDLDWDVRRFRPNVVIAGPSVPFAEDGWSGRRLAVGSAELVVRGPTVRCAMPLRAQPGLARQPEMFAAMTELNARTPNHLGVYVDVERPGVIRPGDPVVLR